MTLSFADPETSRADFTGISLAAATWPAATPTSRTSRAAMAGSRRVGQSFATGTAATVAVRPTTGSGSDRRGSRRSWNTAHGHGAGQLRTGVCPDQPAARGAGRVRRRALSVDEIERLVGMSGRRSGVRCVKVVNIVGFFLDSVAGPAEICRLHGEVSRAGVTGQPFAV